MGSACSPDFYDHEMDSTQNFCDELNKRQIMPMELMQARSHHRFAETADKVFNELTQVRLAVRKTAQYVKDRQAEIDRIIEEFGHDADIKLETHSSNSSGISSDDDSRKRSSESDAPTKPPIKRVKHGISDILGSGAMPVREVKGEPPPIEQKVGPTTPFDRLQQSFYYNFNRLQQAQQEHQQALQQHQQQQQVQQYNPYVQSGPQQTAQVAQQTAQGQPGNRYWSDAMYSLLLRAQQTQQVTDRLPGADGRVPSQHSDSGHESGNADSGSEIDVIQNDPNPVAVPVSIPVAETPAPTHQIKPQWIVKRMEKLKRKRAARENGEDDIDVEGDAEDEDDIPDAGVVEIGVDDSELGPAIIGGVGTGVITKDANGKTQISCKQCRWTLRKWESWAKKRNLGTLPGLETKSDTFDPAPSEFLSLDTTEELVRWMSHFIKEIRKDSGEAYQIDSITAFAFSLQKVLKETGRQVDILRNEKFVVFLEAMNDAMDCSVKTVIIQPTPRQDEETLWQSGELGYHSPEALTQTLVMIIVKHLKIRSSQAHRDMEMSDFEKVKIFNPSNPTQLLEIYRFKDSRGNAKRGEIVPNLAKPERCPVRIIDYYLEKRPVAIRHSGPFYLWPSDQKTIDRMSWFRVKPLSKKYLLKCLCRIKQTNLHDI